MKWLGGNNITSPRFPVPGDLVEIALPRRIPYAQNPKFDALQPIDFRASDGSSVAWCLNISLTPERFGPEKRVTTTRRYAFGKFLGLPEFRSEGITQEYEPKKIRFTISPLLESEFINNKKISVSFYDHNLKIKNNKITFSVSSKLANRGAFYSGLYLIYVVSFLVFLIFTVFGLPYLICLYFDERHLLPYWIWKIYIKIYKK
jgi:hypothetical protein